jgi:hypothetical protein
MNNLSLVLNDVLTILGAIVLLMGFRKNNLYYVLLSLWIALLAFFIDYKNAGGEILGSYFDYHHAFMYSINIIVILAALGFTLITLAKQGRNLLRILSGFLGAALVTGGLILLINLWINANFVENRLPGTAIIQVISNSPPEYCHYQYVFYSLNTNNKVSYLCPNFYGLVPSTNTLETPPEFIAKHLAKKITKKS